LLSAESGLLNPDYPMRAYLDIETSFTGAITVIGLYSPGRGAIQLVGGGVTDLNLYAALADVTTLVTFNGSGFDLPVIRKRLLADLRAEYDHRDLLYVCRKRGLRGGLKVVEQRLGIARASAGLTGFDAPRLWERYERLADAAALETLLAYNYDDVVNLAILEAHLDGVPIVAPDARCNILTK
jgi:uncharacterized protein